MSINWVMLDGQTFVPLPRERVLFTSPPRTSLTLQTSNSYPGKEPLSIKCSDGKAIITNQRLIYLPTTPTPTLQSVSAPLLNLQDTHVSAPFFGPNVWDGILIPVVGGGIPAHHNFVQIKLTFREGGAFDFHNTFERMKETLGQAVDMARESGRPVNSGNVVDVDLEQLPAYEEATNGGRPTTPTRIHRPTPISPHRSQQPRPAPPANNGVVGLNSEANARPGATGSEALHVPDEPPPGYDEVQQSSVANGLERRVEKSG